MLASGPAGSWAAHGYSALSHVDPASAKATKTFTLADVPLALGVGDGELWIVAPPTNRVFAIDPATGAESGSVQIAHLAYGPTYGAGSGIVLDDTSVWVPTAGGVTRFDRFGLGTIKRIPTGRGALSIARGDDAVWVSNYLSGTVSRIDPRTNKVVATIKVGGEPTWIGLMRNRLWVAVV